MDIVTFQFCIIHDTDFLLVCCKVRYLLEEQPPHPGKSLEFVDLQFVTMGGIGKSSDESPMRHDDGGSPSRFYHAAIHTPNARQNGTSGDARRQTPRNAMAYEMPTRKSQRTRSGFVFLSDRKSVPTELKNLEEKTIKRRRDFLARMHELVRNGLEL